MAAKIEVVGRSTTSAIGRKHERPDGWIRRLASYFRVCFLAPAFHHTRRCIFTRPLSGTSFASLLTLIFGEGREVSVVLLRPIVLEKGSKWRTNQECNVLGHERANKGIEISVTHQRQWLCGKDFKIFCIAIGMSSLKLLSDFNDVCQA